MTKSTADIGPQERHQHDTLASRETGQAGVVGVLVVTSGHLNRLHGQGTLGEGRTADIRKEAGTRIAFDWEAAGRQPCVTGSMSEYISNGSAEYAAIRNVDAYKRLHKALDALPGGCKGVVLDVCCLDAPAGSQGRLEALRRGLDALARAYGIR